MSYSEKASNYGTIAVSDRAGQVIQDRRKWAVSAHANNDQVLVGYLPAGHRLVKELCKFIADGNTPAMTLDVCIGNTTQKLNSAVAVTASTFLSQASTITDAVCETIGEQDDVNTDVFLNLTTAPTTAGGNVYVVLAYVATPFA